MFTPCDVLLPCLGCLLLFTPITLIIIKVETPKELINVGNIAAVVRRNVTIHVTHDAIHFALENKSDNSVEIVYLGLFSLSDHKLL